MPPRTNSLDGISRPSAPASPAQPPLNTANSPAKHNQLAEDKPKVALKGRVETSKVSHGPTMAILITLIFMVLLIGLAYFAYNKSK